MLKRATFAWTTETGENPSVFEHSCHFFVAKPPLGGFLLAKDTTLYSNTMNAAAIVAISEMQPQRRLAFVPHTKKRAPRPPTAYTN
ncbi:hypothetical protein B0G75_102285 [Paraburkholderia sp. BL18I3N2]|nr:hypothetical protein B0G75_102285 [Paraburkholderia sp. BL18I3N2]